MLRHDTRVRCTLRDVVPVLYLTNVATTLHMFTLNRITGARSRFTNTVQPQKEYSHTFNSVT
jgi:hypothetical protein